MTVYLSPLAVVLQYFSNIGVPLAGGTVTIYLAGTSIPQATYTDSTGDVQNANPLTLNSAGRLNSVSIWQPQGVAIKAVIEDSQGNTLATWDEVQGINDISVTESDLSNPASGSGADLVANAVRSFASFNDARSASAPVMQSGQTRIVIFEGGNAVSDGLEGAFYWDATATTSDDGLNVIAPAAGAVGRYLRLSSVVSQTAIKSSSTTRASTTSVTADPDLAIYLPAAGIYSIEGWLNDASGTSSGGLKGTVAFSGSASGGGWAMNGNGTDVTTVGLTALGTAAEMQSAQAGAGSMRLDGYLNCTTPGTLIRNSARACF